MSIAAALAAAEVAPDPDPSDPPQHKICVASDGSPHVESVVIDNSTGVLGDLLSVEFFGSVVGTNWCDDGLGSEAAGIVFVGQPGSARATNVYGLRTDAADCSRPRPVLDVQEGEGTLQWSVVRGGPTALTGAVGDHQLVLMQSLVDQVVGPAVAGGPTVWIGGSVVSSGQLSGQALVENLVPGGGILIQSSVFFGSVISGAPLIDSAGGVHLWDARFLGNVVYDSPLVQLTPDATGIRYRSSIMDCEFAGNRLLTGGAATPAISIQPLTVFPTGGFNPTCLPPSSHSIEFHSRAQPVATGMPSTSPLIALGPHVGITNESFRLYRNYFVDNEVGAGGAVLELEPGHIGTELFLLHNLLDSPLAPLLRASGGSACSLHSGRNLLLGQPFNDLGGVFATGESSMDVVVDESQWLTSVPPGIYGPTLEIGAPPTFDPPGSVAAESDCARSVRTCPEVGVGCPGGGFGLCVLGGAMAYQWGGTSPGDWADQPWPWPDTVLDVSPPWSFAPGPQGWACFERPVPSDSFEKYDADGYTDLVDCDNLDASVIPILPTYDGYDVPWCNPTAGGCYTCPPDSCWPPGVDECPELPGDDDDSAGDDDDSAADDDDTVDDDDSSAVDGDDAISTTVIVAPTGCEDTRGCGVPLPIAANGFLLVLATGLRRRRRSDPP